MLRRVEKGACGTLFDNLTVLHYHDPVGNISHHPQVVADKHQRAAMLALEPLQQAQN